MDAASGDNLREVGITSACIVATTYLVGGGLLAEVARYQKPEIFMFMLSYYICQLDLSQCKELQAIHL